MIMKDDLLKGVLEIGIAEAVQRRKSFLKDSNWRRGFLVYDGNIYVHRDYRCIGVELCAA